MQHQNGSTKDVLTRLNDTILSSTVPGSEVKPKKLTASAFFLSATVNQLGNATVDQALSEVCINMILVVAYRSDCS